jgi:hypothetical protein
LALWLFATNANADVTYILYAVAARGDGGT